ncbi:hypothetical protein ASG05_14925 [Frigoribacterium sp. Leaf186]|jgi:hypothetical protein|nr:hypothetical protein ASG05_14925 [Frigoribacterium sp. Leaf186]
MRGMRAGTATYGKTLAGVLAVLSDVDPYGLEPGQPDGAPSDECEMEAVDLVRILLRADAVTILDVEAVWMRWFSESLVLRLGPPRMAQLVDRLNALVDGAR